MKKVWVKKIIEMRWWNTPEMQQGEMQRLHFEALAVLLRTYRHAHHNKQIEQTTTRKT